MKTLILVVLLMAPAFAQSTVDREIAIGNAMWAQMDGRSKAMDDGAVVLLVNRIVERLSRGVVLRHPLRLKLVESEEASMSALPGGILVFSSGAIARADSEAELAAEVAHQIAHFQEPLDLQPPTIIRPCVHDSTNILPSRILERAADRENDADLLAAGYLANAGYEPQALLTLYDRTQHRFAPNSEVRRIVSERSMAMTDAVLDTHEFQEIKARLTGAKPVGRTPTLYR
jgi:predicted Zn-dependent protease